MVRRNIMTRIYMSEVVLPTPPHAAPLSPNAARGTPPKPLPPNKEKVSKRKRDI